ncbi:transcriptional regulator [Bacillus sp. AFS018417]|uniref:helix-turn-helix domain-containing protein n=1 Tax=Bacillus sp. AFS018417 TaxID=2033491 RepID=UPI000BF67859|nr:helix-turn-helix transcriptional regulator [Bacillus sp. AFS018417]PEZ09145.1 transcriptional regulator [Bacillus sp. AFS018417]
MHEGKIIKFHREKAGLTQEQLVKGICSVTHISKIERGITEYSSEIITLLSERLGIDMNQEIHSFRNIERQLHRWHDFIIMECFKKSEKIKNKLEKNKWLYLSDYHLLYKLLQAKYYLLYKNEKSAYEIAREVQINYKKLTSYEQNLFKHIMGKCYLLKKDIPSAINTLKTIDAGEYNNPEYYYDLALAYHKMNSKLMAYYYAEKALQFFKASSNFRKIIDAEMLMLMQIEENEYFDFKETVVRYENLIQNCDLCNVPYRKASLIQNLALQYFKRKEYNRASELYKKAIDLKRETLPQNLTSLYGYIQSCFKGNLLSNKELLRLTHEGMASATNANDFLSTILFTLLVYLIEDKEDYYHEYIETYALPFFQANNYVKLVQLYEQELFNYYFKTGMSDKALKLSYNLINKEMK